MSGEYEDYWDERAERAELHRQTIRDERKHHIELALGAYDIGDKGPIVDLFLQIWNRTDK